MTTTANPVTTDPPGLVCPPWCTLTEHEDTERPGGPAGEAHDPIADGGFCHVADPVVVECNEGAVEAELSSYLTHGGQGADEPMVMFGGISHTYAETRAIAAALTALVDQGEAAENDRANWQPKGGPAQA
jgi:hypothetical protein